MAYKIIIKLLKEIKQSKKLLLELNSNSTQPVQINFHSKHYMVRIMVRKSNWYPLEKFIEMTIYEKMTPIYMLNGYYACTKKRIKGSNFYDELDKTIGLLEQLSQTGR